MTDTLFKESDVVYSYSREQAIEDGMIVEISKKHGIGMTNNLYVTGGFNDPVLGPGRIKMLVALGLFALEIPDPEDSDEMRLRVVKDDDPETWVIWHGGEGSITFMRPEDY